MSRRRRRRPNDRWADDDDDDANSLRAAPEPRLCNGRLGQLAPTSNLARASHRSGRCANEPMRPSTDCDLCVGRRAAKRRQNQSDPSGCFCFFVVVVVVTEARGSSSPVRSVGQMCGASEREVAIDLSARRSGDFSPPFSRVATNHSERSRLRVRDNAQTQTQTQTKTKTQPQTQTQTETQTQAQTGATRKRRPSALAEVRAPQTIS